MYAIAYLIDGLLTFFGMALEKTRIGRQIQTALMIVMVIFYVLAFARWAYDGTFP